MSIQSRQTHKYHTIPLPILDCPAPPLNLAHHNTRVDGLDAERCANGMTMWLGSVSSHDVFLAFEWVEIRPEVHVLADPNRILSNVEIVDQLHQPVSPLKRVMHLNLILHTLLWQPYACNAADSFRRQQRTRKKRSTLHINRSHERTVFGSILLS
jgi:hypothetical protein